MRGVVVRTLPSGQRALVALRPFSPGEVLLEEAPLLACVPCAETEEVLRWCDAFPHVALHSALTTLAFLGDFCAAPLHVKCEVLDFYSAPQVPVADSPFIQDILRLAEFAKQYDWAATQSVESLRRVILIRCLMCRDFAARVPRGIALFSSIARAPHSCNPSANFSSTHSTGCGTLIARRQVQPGDTVTVAHCKMMLPTKLRRETLKSHWLVDCQCPRCAEWPDVLSTLPCPACSNRDERGLLAVLEEPPGFLIPYHLPPPAEAPKPAKEAKAKAKTADSPPKYGWRCDFCDATTRDPEVALGPLLERRVDFLCRKTAAEQDDVLEAMVSAKRVVGPRHWGHVQCLVLLIAQWASEVPSGGDFPELTAAMDLVLEIASWWAHGATEWAVDGDFWHSELLRGACAAVLLGHLQSAVGYLERCSLAAKLVESPERQQLISRCRDACQRSDRQQATDCAKKILAGTCL
eukprot:GGOE01037448.1.p1 GENE.GGOE01037448.1~~GGOE01037448.1.p1  ORF type:complete len:465 (+),score=81.42 GGOE01037448.1:112-1506(+)